VDSSLVRGSVWIVAAIMAVLAIGWAGTGGCAGAASAQLRADVDGLTSRVQAIEGRMRKLEGGSKAARSKGKGKGKSKLAAAKAKGGKAGLDGERDPANLARTKAKGGKAAPPAEDAEGQVPPG
jgi:hypothetical protein